MTVEVADMLMAEAARIAAEGGTTLDELVEDALRRELTERRERKPFTLRDGSVGGRGLKPEYEGNWDKMVEAIYEDHGA
jgi:Arc/MetJ family transcription regulator